MEHQRAIYQPIHPELREQLDPEYLAFHEQHLQYILPSEATAWDPAVRTASSPFALAALNAVEVGKIQDVYLKHSQLRIFTPTCAPPANGWPVFLWLHCGGWTLGNLDSDNAFCSRISQGASCITVNVNYRHAPEDPYPAAVDDVMEALGWLLSPESSPLGINRTQIAIGGTSAGGNLAAIAAMKAALCQPSIPIVFQMLLLPVIDNTATPDSAHWESKLHAPWLTPSRMMWYRKMYLPDERNCSNWDASPNLAPSEIMGKSPRTWIAVSEHDLLAPEAITFGSQLRKGGVEAEVKTYKGSTHSLLAMSGMYSALWKLDLLVLISTLGYLSLGKMLVQDAVDAVLRAFKAAKGST